MRVTDCNPALPAWMCQSQTTGRRDPARLWFEHLRAAIDLLIEVRRGTAELELIDGRTGLGPR
ncbi:hypothetical protein [Micromonospora tulbaghiae]